MASSSLKKCVSCFLLVLTVLAIVSTPAFAQTPSNRDIDVTGTNGFVQQNWAGAPSGEARITLHFPEVSGEKVFTITAGWLFNAPLKVNGVETPTFKKDGETAMQIAQASWSVKPGDTITVEPTWAPAGTEIGFWWTISDLPSDIAKEVSITNHHQMETFQQNWTASVAGSSAVLHMKFSQNGVMYVDGGWTFDQNMTLDNNPVELTTVQGELAYSIKSFTKTVKAGDEWTWKMAMPDNTAELGIKYRFIQAGTMVFLPQIQTAPVTLEKTATLSKSTTTQLVEAKWPGAVENQTACLTVNFNPGGNATLESGWFFGQLISVKLNGNAFTIPTVKNPGESATAIKQINLPNAKTLVICTNSLSKGREIGLRIRY